MRNNFWSLLESLWAVSCQHDSAKSRPQMSRSCIPCCGARRANDREQEDMRRPCCRASRLWTGLGSAPTDSVTSAVIWRCSVMHPLSTGTLVIIRCQHLSFQVPFVPAAYRQIRGWKGGNNFSYVLSNSAQLPISPEYRSACSLRWTRAEQSNIFFYARSPTTDLLTATQLDVCRDHLETEGTLKDVWSRTFSFHLNKKKLFKTC